MRNDLLYELSPEDIQRWRKTWTQTIVENRNRLQEPPLPLPRCPRCQFQTLMLWKYQGEAFFKCEHCNYELH